MVAAADVSHLYSSHPIHPALALLADMLRALGLPDTSLLLDLLKYVLTHNFVSYREQVYPQIKGTAIGTPAAVVLAHLYLAALERQLFSSLTLDETPFSTLAILMPSL